MAHLRGRNVDVRAADETAEWAVGPYLWWPEGRYFSLPEAGRRGVSDALEAAATWVRDLAPWSNVAVDGVATGFDDGDFLVVYPA